MRFLSAGFSRIPLPIILVCFGFLAHLTFEHYPSLTLNPRLLGYFLPALIFEAAWDFDAGALRRTLPAIVVLAVPGVVATTAIIACGVVLTHEMTWMPALLLGAIVAATDPVAVLALFRRLQMPHELLAIIEGESVLNDGVAVVLVRTLLPCALGSTSIDILGVSISALAVSGGGIFMGTAAAALLAFVLRGIRLFRVWLIVTIVLAYGLYLLAEGMGFSGIFACATVGLAMPAFAGLKRTDAVRERIETFWDKIAFIANAAVFFLVGFNLTFDGIVRSPLVPVAALSATVIARLFLAYGLVPLRAPANRAWRHAVAFAGLRGGLSLALALGLPFQLQQRGAILNATFAIVFVTLVLQGALLSPFLRRLRFEATVKSASGACS